MDPEEPGQAQQVVIAYARLLERDIAEGRHPARVDSLPYPKSVIKSAISTSVQSVAASGQLSDDLRDFFETAYTSLAEYIDSELVLLMNQYRASADELAADSRVGHEKTSTVAWQTLAEASSLAGEVARSITAEAENLREEFQRLLEPS